MRYLLPKILLLILSFSCSLASAQELICRVSLNANQIQSDRQVYDDMRKTISDFMNFNKFTDQKFKPQERIKCNLEIIVNNRPSTDYFLCTANIRVLRPVYNSTYETVTLNLSDRNFNFYYTPFQQMQFADNAYVDNLTALLTFYAYIIIGTDFDTFSKQGGSPYFLKAQNIAQLASSSSAEAGWRSNESTRNRYWLIENLLNNSYRAYRDGMFKLHRQGLDQMEANGARGRKAVLETLVELNRLNQQNPILMITRAFIDAKNKELPNIFKNAFINDKKRFLEIMKEFDPANMAQYEQVMENN